MNRILASAMTEAELQEAVRRLCVHLGLYHYHPHDSRRSAPGWPDSVIVGRRVLFRELKSEAGRLSPEQRRVLYALEAAGQDAGTWRPRHWADGTVLAELSALT